MRTSQRSVALDAALRLMAVEEGGSITLDRVAREAGITKPGLMYHFPTRDALMQAIVEHAATRVDAQLREACDGRPPTAVSAHERMRAYARIATTGAANRGEYAIYVEAAYRPELSASWDTSMAPWFDLSDVDEPAVRARLTTARLAADGLWAATATGVFAPEGDELTAVLAVIDSLTDERLDPS